jgi:hypothetical protein
MIRGLDPEGTFPTTPSAHIHPWRRKGLLGNRLADISRDMSKVEE